MAFTSESKKIPPRQLDRTSPRADHYQTFSVTSATKFFSISDQSVQRNTMKFTGGILHKLCFVVKRETNEFRLPSCLVGLVFCPCVSFLFSLSVSSAGYLKFFRLISVWGGCHLRIFELHFLMVNLKLGLRALVNVLVMVLYFLFIILKARLKMLSPVKCTIKSDL